MTASHWKSWRPDSVYLGWHGLVHNNEDIMPKIEWYGNRIATAAKQAALEVAQQTAEIVKGKAVDLCPLDTAQTRNRRP